MKVVPSDLPDVLVIETDRFSDDRGHFLETFHAHRYADAGIAGPFVQDNLSYSKAGVLRGLHLQHPQGQGKLIQVVDGAVYDVAVDVRIGSPNFGRWAGFTLSSEENRQIYLPPGFAHGFCVLGDTALFSYKCTDVYDPASELTVRWNDPTIGIDWPVADPVVSPKDADAPCLPDIDPARLPRYDAAGR